MSDEKEDPFYSRVINGGEPFWNLLARDKKAGVSTPDLIEKFNENKGEAVTCRGFRTVPAANETFRLYEKVALLTNLANGLFTYAQTLSKRSFREIAPDGVIQFSKQAAETSHSALIESIHHRENEFGEIWRNNAHDGLKKDLESFLSSYEYLHSRKNFPSVMDAARGSVERIGKHVANIDYLVSSHRRALDVIEKDLNGAETLDDYQLRIRTVVAYLNGTIYPELLALNGQILNATEKLMKELQDPNRGKRGTLEIKESALPAKPTWTPRVVEGEPDEDIAATPQPPKPPLLLANPAQTRENSVGTVDKLDTDWEDILVGGDSGSRAGDPNASWHPVQEKPPTKGVQFAPGVGEPTQPALQNGASVIPLKFSGVPKKSITTDGAEPAGVIDLVARLAVRKPNGNLTGL